MHKFRFLNIVLLSSLTLSVITCMAENKSNNIYNKKEAPNQLVTSNKIDTKAKHAILVDVATGSILYEKNSDQTMPPSSMTKIMTIYMVFKKLKEGIITMEDTLLVSEKAWRLGGSKMFVGLGERIKVSDLLRGAIVSSGNDAVQVLAEGLASSDEDFVREMNEEAKKMGANNTNFKNPSGYPEDGHYSTAKDIAIISLRIMKDFPEQYHMFKEIDFTYNGIKQGNRNPLLYMDIGADGIKTGHAEAAGYGVSASAVQNGQRLLLVIHGLDNAKDRATESERLLRYGFREFSMLPLFKKNTVIDEAPVWLGDKESVPLIVPQDISISVHKAKKKDIKARVFYKAPISNNTPLGTQVGYLEVIIPEEEPIRFPLVTGNYIAPAGFMKKILGQLRYLLWGINANKKIVPQVSTTLTPLNNKQLIAN